MKPTSSFVSSRLFAAGCALAAALLSLSPAPSRGEAMLQFFNAKWTEIAEKVPELAEAGYTSIWLPPPAKANGGYSVGYDLFDPFDLGSTNLRDTWSTRYGTEAELHNLVDTLHRFGIRVYFDNIMNHRAYDIPGFNESTPIDVYPGMVAEDFHLRRTSDGFYRKWDNCRDWNDGWQVMNLGLSDLIDIAHETPNCNHGTYEGATQAKPSIVRHPNNPEFYDRMPNVNVDPSLWNPWDWSGNTNANIYVGFGPDNGITTEMIAQYPDFFKEDVGAYLCRSVRWMMHTTKADGFRLDAVKHVPDYFFGEQWSADKDGSNVGYCGNIQWQFNMTHGYSDWDNHRDTVFDTDAPRDDAMVFGEHLGSPPGLDGYIAAGMRLVDNPLRNQIVSAISSYNLWGYDQAGYGGLAPGSGVMHSQSHDNVPQSMDRRPLEQCFYMMRQGLGLFYTDGNNHAATLSGSGGAFPRWAESAYLGQWGDTRMPNLCQLNGDFGRGWQKPVYSQGDFVAWERIDGRNGGNSEDNSSQVTCLVLANAGWDYGQPLPSLDQVSFPHTSGGANAYLYQYADVPYINWNPHFYVWASNLCQGEHSVPPNAYYIFGYKNPDPSSIWPGNVIDVLEDGVVAETIPLVRTDGADGDAGFNPYSLQDDDKTDYSYTIHVPRVTKGTNVQFRVNVDGSAADVLLRLDGGMDLNGVHHNNNEQADIRDNPPALATDVFLGFEGINFDQRIWAERFAARVSDTNGALGSGNATTYVSAPDGASSMDCTNVYSADTSYGQISWVWHDPAADTDALFVSVTTNTAGSTNIYTDAASSNTSGSAAAIPGFGVWSESKYGNAGWFVNNSDPAASGVNGMDYAYGLYANADTGSGVTIQRAFTAAPGSITRFSIKLGVNWDNQISDSYKGFELYDDEGAIFGLQMGGAPTITYYGVASGNYSADYGVNAFTVSVVRTSSGYAVTGSTRNGGTFSTSITTSRNPIGYKVYMNGCPLDDGKRQMYFTDASYTAVSSASSVVTNLVPSKQLVRDGASVTVYAKTPKAGGMTNALYYTTDGVSWPNGGAATAANAETKVAHGEWIATGTDGASDWWKFAFTLPSASTTLRYKLGIFHKQGTLGANDWDIPWPDGPGNVAKKVWMLGQWSTIPQDLTCKEYYKHNDYANDQKGQGLPDGLHLLTARAFLNRTDGTPVYKTFRQTFMIDRETPRGELLYPDAGTSEIGGSEYGFILRTDPTVTAVYYHITDSNDDNNTVGNGTVSNAVVWGQATVAGPWTREMTQNTTYPKLWRFTYPRIPSSGNATVRIRLVETSSASTNEWSATDPAEDSASALHFTEITKPLATRGDPENFYFQWPDTDGTYVEEGWNLRLNYSKKLVWDIDPFAAFKVYIQSEENASTNRGTLFTTNDIALRIEGWSDAEDSLVIPMPNVYNGIQGWLYGVRVELVNTNAGHNYVKAATRFVTHHGARKPTVAITTPPEVDSDGAAYVIELPDAPASVLADPTNAWMRQTPIVVQTDLAVTNVDISFLSAPEGASTNIAFKSCNTNTGSLASWSYVWTVSAPGAYRFTATGWANTNGTTLTVSSNTAVRNATIQFKEMASNTDTNNLDWDDDGILNSYENTRVSLPTNRVEESWQQDEVFIHFASGRSSDTSPDTDSDGLPDALELGYRACQDYSATDASADSNADGWPNAIRDLDPPFYNTKDNSGKVPKAEDVSTTAPRTTLRAGSVTDPSNPDSDYDGIPDGLEDANRNGWTDGDGSPFDPDWTPGEEPWNPWLEFNWPDREIGSGEHWEETSPCIADSDSDGLSDGYGEDLNFNGYTDLGVRESATGAVRRLAPADYAAYGIGIDNASTRYSSSTLATKPYTSRALDYSAIRSNLVSTTAYPRVVFYETDPLESDTDGDGLPDGWEVQNGLDPLDDGVYSYRDGGPGNPRNGAAGDPDGDGILNAEEYGGGTDPNVANTAEHPEGEGAITIGRGAAIGAVNGVTNYNEYLDWSLDDLIALDDYDQGGNVSDIYRGFNDGWESSRDLVAFYFHDGGDRDAGGDGKLYFRVDLFDLQAYAEEGHLDVYVAINFGNYGSDKAMAELPNAVNCKSAMKWNAVVGVWDSANGLLYTTDGSTVRESASDFYGAYFNSQLDSIAWSINRQALVDAGWKTGDPDSLMFQVYTTKDFTNDDGGSGDKGGLNDFTDTIGDDWLCSDYHQDWNYVANHGLFTYCVGRVSTVQNGGYVFNSRGAHAKLALLAHGNQADERSAVIQNYVNNGEGAGYHRPVLIHNIYTNCPLNLHITPTLAMALQWAEADPAKNQAWRSGPALNAQIAEGVAKGNFRLLGSTYSDHILPYFSRDFNAADVALANDTLNAVYGGSVTSSVVSTNILWSSERVAGRNVFRQIHDLGYRATIIDQTPHLQDWVNREYALGDNGYKINAFWFPTTGSDWASIDAFVISSAAADYRYATSDSGLSTDLRKLFIRRARSGQALLSTLFYNWEDFASSGNADAYDLCLRWIANHPWIKVVTLEDALGSVDRADEDNKNALYHSGALRMQDWVNHACNEDYDNWYFGSLRSDGVRRHESLADKKFELRAGATNETPLPYGTMTNGLLASAWAAVDAISNPSVKRLALETIAASVFETAFHNEDNNNLTRWSYGDYVWPSEEPNMGLQGFAWAAQGQTRMAAIYSNVDVWARTEIVKTQVITNLDLDLDGEPEPILRNNAVMAVFERQGGRMVGAWLKDDGTTNVVQMIGNFVSMPYSGWEDEGLDNGSARRAAGLVDWWDNTAKTNAVNILYNAESNDACLTLTNTTTHIGKQIYLDSNTSTTFRVTYRIKNSGGFSVRSGISPDLDGLLALGDAALAETTVGNTITLTTSNAAAARLATVTLNVVTGDLHTATTDYSDTNLPTINMRNLPQTRQVEVHTTGNRLDFTIDLSATSTEPEEDPGTPPEWSQLPNSAVTVGTLWSFTPSTCVTGAPAPTITVSSTATGWNFTDGLFTFTPAAPGTYTFTFTATNAAGSTDATLTISATALDPYTQWMADKGYTNDVPARTNIAPGGQTYEWHYVTDISPADSNTTLEIVLTNDAFTIDPASTNRLYHLLWTTDLTKPYVTNTLGRSSPTTTHPFPTNTSWYGGLQVTIP